MSRKTRKQEVQKQRERQDPHPTESFESSAAAVKFLRRLGYKQVDIARLLEKSPAFVSKVNRGRRPLYVEQLEKLAEGIGVPPFCSM